jgi:hypothetical protein
MEMTIRNQGDGTYAFGSYAYDEIGKSQRFWGPLGDSGFAFELSDAEGEKNWVSRIYSSRDMKRSWATSLIRRFALGSLEVILPAQPIT